MQKIPIHNYTKSSMTEKWRNTSENPTLTLEDLSLWSWTTCQNLPKTFDTSSDILKTTTQAAPDIYTDTQSNKATLEFRKNDHISTVISKSIISMNSLKILLKTETTLTWR